MHEPRESQFLGPGSTADHVGSLDDKHAPVRPRQFNGGGEPVGACTNDDGVVTGHRIILPRLGSRAGTRLRKRLPLEELIGRSELVGEHDRSRGPLQRVGIDQDMLTAWHDASGEEPVERNCGSHEYEVATAGSVEI